MRGIFARRPIAALAACLLVASCGPDGGGGRPERVGECVVTTVKQTGPRLEGAPDSGSFISYANGLAQVDYDVLPGIAESRAGDQVRLCLVSIPEGCPAGDTRGRVYSATNMRTGKSWSAPDSQHMCGGA